MKVFNFDADVFAPGTLPIGMINDWYDLAPHIGVQPYQIAYARKSRDRLQVENPQHKNGETRMVYISRSPLNYIQKRIYGMLTKLSDEVLDKNVVIAYQKGVNAAKVISEDVDKKYQVKFDIRKYFDHITYTKIVDTLVHYGFTRLGAGLIAQLCVVKRTVKGRQLQTLQQGSSASSVISNLVGSLYIDQPIANWITKAKAEYPHIEITYRRYCDNIKMTFDGEGIPLELLKDLQRYKTDALAKNKFWTHQWQCTPSNHPKCNQSFLGVVLNKNARMENVKFNSWRATLFNACRSSLEIAAKNYWDKQGRSPSAVPDTNGPRRLHLQKEIDNARFMMVVKGRCAYLKSICPKQWKQLYKLTAAVELLSMYPDVYERKVTDVIPTETDGGNEPKAGPGTWTVLTQTVISGDRNSRYRPVLESVTKEIDPAVMAILKTYKDSTESPENFKQRLEQIISTLTCQAA